MWMTSVPEIHRNSFYGLLYETHSSLTLHHMSRILVLLFFLAGTSASTLWAQCNAGSDAVTDLCANSEVTDLNGLLSMDADPVGFWEAPDGSVHDGMLDPQMAVPGLYAYIVNLDAQGAPCLVPDTAFVDVQILDVFPASFAMDMDTGCEEAMVRLENTSNAPGYTSCRWDFGDGGASTICNPEHTFSGEGTYDVTLTISNGAGCESSVTMEDAVTINASPVASFSLKETPISTVDGEGSFVNESVGGVSYEWIIPGIGVFTDSDPVVVFPSTEDSYYVCLEVTAANGCTDSYCSNVLVRDDVLIYVPSAFTADQDFVNDVFKPELSFSPDLYRFEVFDRWGNVVFGTDDPAQGWNGSQQANDIFSPDSYYAWRIKVVKDATVIERKGHVLMLR